MARSSKPAPADPHAHIADERAISTALATARAGAPAARGASDLEFFRLGQQVGAIQMARLQRNFSDASEIRLFAQLRESKKYKDLALPRPDGSSAPAETITEFCQLVFGRSYSAMAEQQQNLQVLGEETYELASALGLNNSALRAVRALPPEKLESVKRAIGSGAAKADVLAVIEDLAVRVEEATEQLAERQAELEVANEARAKQRKRIDDLEKRVRRFDKLEPDEKLLELQKEAAAAMNDARAAILGRLRQALEQLGGHGEEIGAQNALMAGLVAEVQRELDTLRTGFGLADTAAEALPEWLRDDAAAVSLQQAAGTKTKGAK